MRVKLSYTVDEDDVLKEAAKIVNLCGDDLQHIVGLFNDIQKELRGESDETTHIPNINKSLEMAEEFRKALLNIDTRTAEVVEIIEGYEDYRRAKPPQDDPTEARLAEKLPDSEPA